MNQRKIAGQLICIDLDMTLAGPYSWPSIGEPNEKMLQLVREWLDEGYKIQLFTARPKEHEEGIREWLDNLGLEQVDIITNKPGALVFIDDRSINPTDLTPEEIKERVRNHDKTWKDQGEKNRQQEKLSYGYEPDKSLKVFVETGPNLVKNLMVIEQLLGYVKILYFRIYETVSSMVLEQPDLFKEDVFIRCITEKLDADNMAAMKNYCDDFENAIYSARRTMRQFDELMGYNLYHRQLPNPPKVPKTTEGINKAILKLISKVRDLESLSGVYTRSIYRLSEYDEYYAYEYYSGQESYEEKAKELHRVLRDEIFDFRIYGFDKGRAIRTKCIDPLRKCLIGLPTLGTYKEKYKFFNEGIFRQAKSVDDLREMGYVSCERRKCHVKTRIALDEFIDFVGLENTRMKLWDKAKEENPEAPAYTKIETMMAKQRAPLKSAVVEKINHTLEVKIGRAHV